MSDTKRYKILVINPGSTSTKVSLFENEDLVFERSLFHDADELLKFPHVNGQMPFRYDVIINMLKDEGVDPECVRGQGRKRMHAAGRHHEDRQ